MTQSSWSCYPAGDDGSIMMMITNDDTGPHLNDNPMTVNDGGDKWWSGGSAGHNYHSM